MTQEEIISFVTEKYEAAFLDEIAVTIGHTEVTEQKLFAESITYAAMRYLVLKQANPKRLTPASQNKLFKKYTEALDAFMQANTILHADPAASAKFYTALRIEYENQSPFIKEMLSPYITDTGYSGAILEQFIKLLAHVAENAKNQTVGYDKADLTKSFLIAWIAAIRCCWSKNPAINFGLGDYLKETGSYKSPALDVIYALIVRIEPTMEKTYLGNILKEVIKDDIKQPPAFFMFGNQNLFAGPCP